MKTNERAYEVKFAAYTDFAILPGEDPIEFEILRGQVAEELAPDGPLEEDLVLTIAKCIWRKRRYQRFLAARAFAAQFDPSHEACNELLLLGALYDALPAMSFEEIEQSLDQLGAQFTESLDDKCPRDNFRTPGEWGKAIQKEVQEVLMPAATRFGCTPDVLLIKGSSAVLTDDVFSRELEFEARIDRTIEQTLDRLEKVKAAKRRVSFREAQRFSRSHQGRLVRFVK